MSQLPQTQPTYSLSTAVQSALARLQKEAVSDGQIDAGVSLAELLPREIAQGKLIYRVRDKHGLRYIPFMRGCIWEGSRTLGLAIRRALYTYEELDREVSRGSLGARDRADAARLLAKGHQGGVEAPQEIIPELPLLCARCGTSLRFWQQTVNWPEVIVCTRCDAFAEVDGYQRTLTEQVEIFNQRFASEQKVSGTFQEHYQQQWEILHTNFEIEVPVSLYFETPLEMPTLRYVYSGFQRLLYRIHLDELRADGFHEYEQWRPIKSLEEMAATLTIDPATCAGWFWQTARLTPGFIWEPPRAPDAGAGQ